MQFELTILGSNAAIHAYDRFPTSQILNYNGNQLMVDCGEGSQFRMTKFGIKRSRLDNIFISHLHSDHFYGVAGMLTSFNLNNRDQPLHIYAPPGLEEIIQVHFKHSQTILKFPLHFHPTQAEKPEKIYEDNFLTVETIILKHRVPTTGFLFREKPGLRNILADKIAQYQIPHDKILGIKQGNDFTTADGTVIANTELSIPPHQPRAYAYCSDTIYTEDFIEQIKGIDLLYHEATFIDEHAQRAQETFHTTTKQAAKIAKLAGVKKLLIGHFSARYPDLNSMLAEAREVFPATELAIEGTVFEV